MKTGAEGLVANYLTPEELWNKTYPIGESSQALTVYKPINEWRLKFADVPFEDKSGSWQLRYYQEIAVQKTVEAIAQGKERILLTLATGTGKTIISAFDYKSFRTNHKSSKLLFIAHRKEILQQAKAAFQGILKDNNFGELWVDGLEPSSNEYVFASVQTLNNKLKDINLSPDYYDFIIVDEVHHIEAKTYRPILDYFTPKILLGLTATPERMDGADILKDFCNRIAAEIRLPEALNKKLLSPFQYFGITDSIDLTNVNWANGKYAVSELTNLYTKNNIRVGAIINNLNKYLNNVNDVRAIGFCVSIEHATFMAEKFNLAGLKSSYLTSKNSTGRKKCCWAKKTGLAKVRARK